MNARFEDDSQYAESGLIGNKAVDFMISSRKFQYGTATDSFRLSTVAHFNG